jgi:hypothetical protein
MAIRHMWRVANGLENAGLDGEKISTGGSVETDLMYVGLKD